ncbi:MAG: hypothetical protein WBH86_14570 [Thermogutta sp.]|nr:hypothetical protein [Thermogutta sp.]HOP78799.1 hypothetical protein [Thermogutta sp.]HPU05427.1 hypothetical protein [Thermogutta sp.]HPZ81921.1 hypothetical protein [Thermogutta sp.]HQF14631.1 hypothetical protein [Thermogutta sp.]
MIDFEVQRCTRHCAVTGRELKPGEVFYSVLIPDQQGWRRMDYSAEAWHGPPDDCIAWWRTQLPTGSPKKRWAPSEVMIRWFEELADRADQADVRYVLALLMVRRRILRLEGSRRANDGTEILTLFCPLNDTTYEIPAVIPSEDRLQQIEEQIAALMEGDEIESLAGDGANSTPFRSEEGPKPERN